MGRPLRTQWPPKFLTASRTYQSQRGSEEDLLLAENEQILAELQDLKKEQMLDHLEEQYQQILSGERPNKCRLTNRGKGKGRFFKTLAQRDLEDREQYRKDLGLNVQGF